MTSATTSRSRWPSKYHGPRAKQPRITPVVPVADDPRFSDRRACGLGSSTHFDERARREPDEAFQARRILAGRTCSICPVRSACLQWGTSNRLSGFMGGRELLDGKPIDNPEPEQS
ncbi:MAG: hypothetical protein ABI140_18050 [Jatrophihabitantaceae bacterium]